MTPLLKNLFVFATCLIIVGMGYYLITDSGGLSTELGDSDTVRQELITKTEDFIARSAQLQQISIDQSFFTDPVFTSLRSFATEVSSQEIGRNDIFAPSDVNQSIAETEDNTSQTE